MAEQKNKPSGWEIATRELLEMDETFFQGIPRPKARSFSLNDASKGVREMRFKALNQPPAIALGEQAANFWPHFKKPAVSFLESTKSRLMSVKEAIASRPMATHNYQSIGIFDDKFILGWLIITGGMESLFFGEMAFGITRSNPEYLQIATLDFLNRYQYLRYSLEASIFPSIVLGADRIGGMVSTTKKVAKALTAPMHK